MEQEKNTLPKKLIGAVIVLLGLWAYFTPNPYSIIAGIVLVFIGSLTILTQFEDDPFNLFLALWLSLLPAYFYNSKQEYIKRGSKIYKVDYIKSPISKWIKMKESVIQIKTER